MGSSASFSLCQSQSAVSIDQNHVKVSPFSPCIFGVSLSILQKNGMTLDGVPAVVHSIVEYIDSHGLEQKGLFRISSSLNKLKLLREKYERGEDVDLSEEGGVEQAASVLKLFLRELPEAVIPTSVHIAIGNAYKDNKDNPALNHQIKMLLLGLPQEHYKLFKFIGAFLIKVASHSEVNQMTTENLATVFGPCIFHVPFGSDMQEEQLLCNQILLHILRNFSDIVEDKTEVRQEVYTEQQVMEVCSEISPLAESLPPEEENSADLLQSLQSRDFLVQETSNTPTPVLFAKCLVHSLPTDEKVWEIRVSQVLENSPLTTTGTSHIKSEVSRPEEEILLCSEKSFYTSSHQDIRKVDINHWEVTAASLSARERRRLLKAQEEGCSIQNLQNKNKENIPCSISSDDESQLKLNDFVPYTEIEHTEYGIKTFDVDSAGKMPELHSGLTALPEHSYSQNTDIKLQYVPVYRNNMALAELEHSPNISSQNIEAEDLPTSMVSPQHDTSSDFPAFRESSFLKLQALEVDLCSTFLPSQEDSAQGQNHKEPSLPPGRGGREAEGSPAEQCQCVFPFIDFKLLHHQGGSEEALPSVRVLQHESDSTAEENQSPRTSQLLHHITDGDNPLPSPRCPSLTQSQRFNMDPELAPSPPCSQQFIMARGLVSASSSEDAKESTTVAMLTKHIQNLKKKIRKYEEQFEQERNYRPSHNDKTAHPEIMKLMNDLAKSRKQLKDLKLKLSVEEMHKHETEQREMESDLTGVNVEHQGAVESQQQKPSIEETVECLIKRLMEKRQALGLPENMKCTKQERNLMKPLYDRYRMIKQLLCASPAITTIEEEGSDEDSLQQSPEPPTRIISQISTEESLCSQEDDNEPAFVSPLDEMKAVRQPAVPISHLHEASMPELLEHLRETRADKKRLRKALREFEEQFLRQMGRNAQKEDRIPMAEEYYEYKHIKAKLRLLEVLVNKQDASKAI
ncbi:protein FAM13C isoform X3 [Erpetoichthys calabaricus]|uniref:protein FAM13C isoform X3 n=1 Tax=Erpetoichthys calabaricus TaxID=27687 RepID=UPI0022345766|nr:protein FAM13C isoform X3 [Erpetoichthys calabaricus]